MHRWLRIRMTVVITLGGLLAACAGAPAGSEGTTPSAARRPATPLFTEITRAAGLPPTPPDWPAGAYFLPDLMGPGVGLFDFDDDGDLDIVQIRMPPPGRPRRPAPNRLYEQMEDGSFEDATQRSGLADPGYGQGLAVGDVDADGDLDVYFTNYGPDAFYLNNGDGSFSSATHAAGFTGDLWSSSAAFCDIDRDGDLDLYVAHYLKLHDRAHCVSASGEQDFCGPRDFNGVPDALWRNDGNGTFTDISAPSGIRSSPGRTAKGLGVLCADLTGDGWLDFYVSNDGEANHLWVNQGDATFREEAIARGVAVNRHGLPEASMGLALGDVTGDGHFDLFMTHLARENNVLYKGSRAGLFTDATSESGMSAHDLARTGFGCGFLDRDLDGDLDLALVNGRVKRGEALAGAVLGSFWNDYAEPDLLFDNDGRGVFSPVGSDVEGFTSRIEISRGLALGDLDRDGDVDLLVSTVGNGLRLFRNDLETRGRHWVRIRAVDAGGDAPGTVVTVSTAARRYRGVVQPSSSYMSTCDPALHFGLGTEDRIGTVEVLWPDGTKERFIADGAAGGDGGFDVDRLLVFRKGEGSVFLTTSPDRG